MAHNANYVYQNLADIATGIFLNIDNNMLTACQKAANAAMIKVCGSTENCDEMIVDNGLGSRSLEYKICDFTYRGDSLDIDYNNCRPNIDTITDEELGRNTTAMTATDSKGDITYVHHNAKNIAAVIDGRIYWESVKFTDDGSTKDGIIDVASYWYDVSTDTDGNETITDEHKERVNSELAALQTSVQNAISAIESDQKVQYCMTGREFQGYKKMLGTGSKTNPRFPQLTAQMRRIISDSALAKTKENYYAKYDELNAKMSKDYSKLAERKAEIAGQNNKDRRRGIARDSCVNLAKSSAMARSAEPPASAGTYLLAGWYGIGAGLAPIPGVAIASAVMAGVILSSADADANGPNVEPDNTQLTGSGGMQQWNYKETITTAFDWENLVCHKCVRSSQCAKTRNPLVGDKYCETWGEETEKCTDIQF